MLQSLRLDSDVPFLFSGPYPVIWKKGKRVISAGKAITAIDRRFRVVRGHDLQIDRAKVKDTGTFTCSVSTEPVMELTHHVDVLCEYLSTAYPTVTP